MQKIMLNGGEEYEVVTCGAAREMLVVTVKGELNVLTLSQTFSDAQKTDRMTLKSDTSEQVTVYENYTALCGVMQDDYLHATSVYLKQQDGE